MHIPNLQKMCSVKNIKDDKIIKKFDSILNNKLKQDTVELSSKKSNSILEKFTQDIVKLSSKKSNIPNCVHSFFTTPLGAKVAGPIKELCLEKSINPEVIKLEQQMQNMGYCANFADNLEAAKIITKCYENLSQKGYKLPKEVLLMIPEEECIQGFRPYAKKGLELETPIIFNKDFWHSQNNGYFLPGIKHNSTDSPEGIIYHEIGHFLHGKTSLDPKVAIKIWKEKANYGCNIELAKEVGYYAMTGDKFHRGNEFVAEVFAGLMDGKKYSKKVMELYNLLGGPAI